MKKIGVYVIMWVNYILIWNEIINHLSPHRLYIRFKLLISFGYLDIRVSERKVV